MEYMMRITAMEIDWFYTTQGQGEPLLFLHGGFDASANYETFLAELARDFRVTAVDRRGHGRTADTDAPFEYGLMADELAAFARALDLPPFHVVGYSDGANIGLHLAGRFPEAVKSCIAISGNHKGQTGMSGGWLEMVDALSVDFVREHMPQVLEQYAELNPSPAPEAFIAKTKALWSGESVICREALQALRVPTLIVGGDRDVVLPEQLAEMKALIPGASLLVLPYCGHFVFQDFAWSPTAAYAAHLFRDFLTTRFAGHNTDFI